MLIRWHDILVEWFVSAAEWFGAAHDVADGWWWPFDLLASPLDWLRWIFERIAYRVGNLRDWIDNTIEAIGNFLEELDILALLEDWTDMAVAAWEWVRDAATTIGDTIDDWWFDVAKDVGDLVDAAKLFASELVDTANTLIDGLQTNWDNFWEDTFPTLIDAITLDDTISGWFDSFGVMWDGWVDVKDDVVDFVQDPLGWLFDRLEDWFWGPEE